MCASVGSCATTIRLNAEWNSDAIRKWTNHAGDIVLYDDRCIAYMPLRCHASTRWYLASFLAFSNSGGAWSLRSMFDRRVKGEKQNSTRWNAWPSIEYPQCKKLSTRICFLGPTQFVVPSYNFLGRTCCTEGHALITRNTYQNAVRKANCISSVHWL